MIVKEILDIIGMSCLTYLFVASEPMILIKRFIGFKEEKYNEYGVVKQFILRLITCCLCSGFWIGLIVSQSLITAGIVAVVSELIYNKK